MIQFEFLITFIWHPNFISNKDFSSNLFEDFVESHPFSSLIIMKIFLNNKRLELPKDNKNFLEGGKYLSDFF